MRDDRAAAPLVTEGPGLGRGSRGVRRGVAVVLLLLAIAGQAGARSVEERVIDHLDRAAAGGVRPADYHHLVLAFDWRGSLPDPGILPAALDRLAAARSVDPLMADEIRRRRAELAVEAGRPEAARELFRAQGGLEAWWATGPVTLEELADFDTQASPPQGAEWRRAGGTDPLGWVRLSGLGWPARRQLIWLATTVVSDGERAVAARLGAAQVARLWINGQEVLTTGHPMRHAADQAAAGGWLHDGANSVVVAIGSESDDWWLRLRLTAPDGRPLEGVTEAHDPPLLAVGPERDPPEVRGLGAEIDAAVAGGDAEALVARAAFMVDRHPEPVGSGDARDACVEAREGAPGEARLLQWRVTEDPGEAARLLEAAIEAEPDLHWARIALARWLASRGLYLKAEELLATAGDEPAIRAAALDVDAERWLEVALPQLERLVKRWPRCADAVLRLAGRALEARRWTLLDEAEARLEAIAPGSATRIRLAERRAEQCGDAEALLALLRRQLGADPNQPELRIRVARLLVSLDRADEARRVMRDGLARCPDHGALLMEGARLEHDLGDDVEAARLASRLLELRPQDREAQRLLKLLGEGAEEEGWRRTATELWQLADEAPEATPAQVVLDHQEIRFLPARLTEERVQRAILITDAERADEYAQHTVPWVPESQSLRVLAARVLRRDGTEVSAQQGDTPRLAEPELNLYYDTRLRVVRFDDLEDGDLVEICYVLSETAEANDSGPYKGGILTLGDRVPSHRVEVELSGPAEDLPSWELAHLEQQPSREVDEDGVVHLRWSWRDLPATPLDVPPAPRLLTVPHLVYSTHPRWGDLAHWYARHVAPRIRPSRQVEDLARRLTSGIDDRRQRIRRLYRFVTDDIRYVGLELGEHRFRPFSADWVLTHRMGDCKDKAALLVALLDAIGVDARMVLVRTADQGPVATGTALMETFNHAIAYVPGDDLWLDGTATGHALVPPPGVDQGAWVLVVDGATSRPRTTPVPGAGLVRTSYLLRRSEGATVELELSSEATGDAASARRALLAGSRDRRRLERWLQGQFPSAELVGEPEQVMVPGTDPAVVRLEATMPRGALLAGGGIPVFPGNLELSTRLAPAARRSGPLMVVARPDLEWTLEAEIGHPATSLPPDVELHTSFGSLTVSLEPTERGYRVEGRFHLAPGLYPARDASGIRDFLVAAERQLARPLEVP